jgi:2-polyprenyl-3-methyl-5-hydroxy-6-metoxy-1,4-benzoquinol methylase
LAALSAAGVPCVLCGADDARLLDQFRFSDLRHLYFETWEVDILNCLEAPYEDELVPVHRCGACGLEFYPSRLCGTQTLYDAMKKSDSYYMKEKWEFELARAEIAKGQSVLEVGCGPGLFLESVRDAGRDRRVTGLELNTKCVETCRAKGLDVQRRTVEEFAAPNPSAFDVVCAFQVLEHVRDPRAFLAAMFRSLKSDGVCIMTVPNAAGFARHAVNYLGDMPPHHLTRWTADVMQKVAVAHGARLERVVEEPIADYHREWYRTATTVRALSAVLRLRWGRLERRMPYRVMLSLSHQLQKRMPAWAWRYTRDPGHTLYVSFRKLVSR